MALDKTGSHSFEFLISQYFDVHQLSASVRQKWEQATVIGNVLCTCSLDEIARRQQAAELYRLKQQQSSRSRVRAHKRPCQQDENSRLRRAQKLEEKLAVAQSNRNSSLEERRTKANLVLQRSLEAAGRLSERQNERAARLDAKLEQAERVRELQIAAAAARGGETAAHAKAVAAAARAREEADAVRRRADLELRLQRAVDARHELTQTVLASLAPRGAEPFLVRRALTRSILRRQSSSRVLQRCWRAFAAKRLTTRALAARFTATGVPATSPVTKVAAPRPPRQPMSRGNGDHAGSSPKQPATPANTPTATSIASSPAGSPRKQQARNQQPPRAPVALMGLTQTLLDARDQAQDPFEQFARALQSPGTLRAATALLRRLSVKLRPEATAAGVDVLLKRLFPKAQKPDRYPARVFLCAFMILKHPQVVFNQRGEREEALGRAAEEMVAAFEKLLLRIAEPAMLSPRGSSSSLSQSSGSVDTEASAPSSVAALLVAFDAAWLHYLEQFAAWKLADAASLEAELVRIAVEMEASMLAKLGPSGSTSPRMMSPADRQAVVEQVARDHVLLRERIQRLGGQAGITRLEASLAAARANAAAQPPPPGSPLSSPGRSPQSSPARGHATPVRRTPGPSPPSPTTPTRAVTNESLAWELLYDLNFQLPTEDAVASWQDATGETDVMREGAPSLEGLAPPDAALANSHRLRRIAEAAFWDSLAGSEPEHLAGLLSELAMQLAEALPPMSRTAAQVLEALSPGRLQEAIASGAASSLLPAFDQLATLLRELGSPARQAPAMAAHGRIKAELGGCPGDVAGISRALVKALRLMSAQLRLLQIDMSNATLRLLAGSLAGGEGIRYARQKFAEKHEVRPEMPLAALAPMLPHTRAWLAQASGQLLSLHSTLPASSSSNAGPSGGSSVPSTLRTGQLQGEALPAPSATARRPAAVLVHSPAPRSWRGLVRLGLVSLVAAEEPVAAPARPLAETLVLDAGRIHEAKVAFQHLLVLAACQLLVQQAAADRRSQLPDMAALQARLKALLADPSLGLASLAAELARSASSTGPLGSAAQEEGAMAAALKRMLARSSPGFGVISSGFTKVLQQWLLLGAMPAAELRAALARIGGGGLVTETVELAEMLQAIAAVSEAVHDDVYARLASDLL